MSLEKLITGVSERSTSLHESLSKGGGSIPTLTFKDMVRSAVGLLDSKFDQELVLFVYIGQGDVEFLHKQLLNMVYSEVPDIEGLVSKIDQLKRTANYSVYFKGTRSLDDMLRSCAYLAIESAIRNRRISSREAASKVGCSKDTYINQYRETVETIAQNLSERLLNAERKIKAVIYE